MKPGDMVFIFDLSSDLYTKYGEIVRIDGAEVVVMVRIKRDFIVDRFKQDKLYIRNVS